MKENNVGKHSSCVKIHFRGRKLRLGGGSFSVSSLFERFACFRFCGPFRFCDSGDAFAVRNSSSIAFRKLVDLVEKDQQ